MGVREEVVMVVMVKMVMSESVRSHLQSISHVSLCVRVCVC